MAKRCPVHDVILSDNDKCPRFGDGPELGFSTEDCDIHNDKDTHQAKREADHAASVESKKE